MSGILPSASLTVSIASMASMVAEGWAKEEKEKEDRKREKMTESQRGDEVQRKREEKENEVKAETCFCVDMC